MTLPEAGELLAPISEDAPCGEDMAFSLEYDRIQEARRGDDPTLDQGEWVTDLKVADWAAVHRDTTTLLAGRTKDLQLAVWFAEASVRLHGFRGLAQGYRVVAGLCEQYWGDMYPQDRDDEHEQRIGNFSWLVSHSIEWIREIPLIQGPQGSFSQIQLDTARIRQNSPDEHAAAIDGLPPLEVMEAARHGTSREFYAQLVEAVPDCEVALKQLEDVVDALLGHEGPSFGAVRDQLAYSRNLVMRYAKDAGVLLDGEPEQFAGEDPAAQEDGAPVAQGGVVSSQINSRREALAQLRRVADFFRRTEPHSPVAYLAEKAARWGEMPLHVWLKRVIKDDSTLAQVEELLDVDENRGE